MEKINVLVVPEKSNFIRSTSYDEEIYINKKLGIPQIAYRNARYVAPFWLDEKVQGVKRIYHILDTYDAAECTVVVLGNSFHLPQPWNNMGSHRKFEYHDLSSFGFRELQQGILVF